METDSVLEVRNLHVEFLTRRGILPAVHDISFKVKRGKILGVVGESGCGKSVTSLSILRLLPAFVSRVTQGDVLLNGKSLFSLSESEMRKIRGHSISMIFQEPMTSLNPVFTVGDQVAEVLRIHKNMGRDAARARVLELMELVGISDGIARLKSYPHQLSGGMRQRVMIAMALACEPDVLIADEPTTALDVTIQAQVLDLLKDLQKKMGMSIVLVTHDLGIVSEYCDEVIVMYAGSIVESGTSQEVLQNPRHPYTQGLLGCLPTFTRGGGDSLEAIPGMVPDLLRSPTGCRFSDRCKYRIDLCDQAEPALRNLAEEASHKYRCIKDWKE